MPRISPQEMGMLLALNLRISNAASRIDKQHVNRSNIDPKLTKQIRDDAARASYLIREIYAR